MKLSDIITDPIVKDINMRCMPENGVPGDGKATLDVVRKIAENGAVIAAAALGVTFDEER